MKTKLILAVIALAAGAGLVWQGAKLRRLEAETRAMRQARQTAPAPMAAPARTEAASPPAVEEQELKLEVARLRRELGAALRARAEQEAQAAGNAAASSSAASVVPDAGVASNALANLIQGAVDLSAEAQIARARERLGLTADQEQSVRDAVSEALDKGRADLERVLTGKAKPEDVPTTDEWGQALEARILSVLSPEQQASYRQYKHTDMMAQARLSAYGELLTLQSPLGLSPDQQDQVFGVLYEQTLSRLDPEPGREIQRPRDPVEATRGDQVRRLEALQSAPTPQQLETYARLQEMHLRFVAGLLGRSSP